MEKQLDNKVQSPPVWRLRAVPQGAEVQRLKEALGGKVSDFIIHLLLQRDIRDFNQAKAFFNPSLEALHDPLLMRDMQGAVDRILRALEGGERILVYGDYDVDGTTAVALVYRFLSEYAQEISYYIPDRYKEGYGLSKAGIDFASDNDFSLLIVLDCGIKAVDQVAYARERSIDVIICDHHTPGQTLPQAAAILNPKRQGDAYPFKALSGCGVGFKLIQALAPVLNCDADRVYRYLGLVAISIAADLVPMTGENRILTHFGLQQINTKPCAGLEALCHFAEREHLEVSDLAFGLGPRINAAGRVNHGSLAVDLLTEQAPQRAWELAAQLEEHNRHRRDLDEQTKTEALAQILENGEQHRMSNVVFSPHWHKGVIGIVASKLIEVCYKPTVVFTQSDDALVASARSVSGFDLYGALEACSDDIQRFGGHKYAAGLTIAPSRYAQFKARFEAVVAARITEAQKRPVHWIDAAMPLHGATLKLYHTLKRFAPFGPGNKKPVFLSRQLSAGPLTRRVGKDASHLKLQLLEAGNPEPHQGIAFGKGAYFEKIVDGRPFDITYSLDLNTYKGVSQLQLIVHDIRYSDEREG